MTSLQGTMTTMEEHSSKTTDLVYSGCNAVFFMFLMVIAVIIYLVYSLRLKQAEWNVLHVAVLQCQEALKKLGPSLQPDALKRSRTV